MGTVQLQLGDDGVIEGDDVDFVWRFDTNSVDEVPDPDFGVYLQDLDGIDVAFAVTDPTTGDPIRDYACDSLSIEIENNGSDGDTYAAAADADFGEFCVDDLGNQVTFTALALADSSGTAFGSDDLPASLDLAGFDPYGQSLIVAEGCFQDNPSCLPSGDPIEDGFFWSAEIDDIVTLPEPAHATWVGVGLMLLLAARRPCRRSRSRAPAAAS
ncbi:MAG: hypothetical protein L0206_18025 [Actinobacteria bacterium]|nr:hypothetical protein [Actinomycetota bacterium]